MAMKYTHDLVATVGKYTDATGQEKNRYLTVGKTFKRDDGSACVKIEQLPVGQEWNGWLNIYPRREQDTAPAATANYAAKTPQGGGAASAAMQSPYDDDIPF